MRPGPIKLLFGVVLSLWLGGIIISILYPGIRDFVANVLGGGALVLGLLWFVAAQMEARRTRPAAPTATSPPPPGEAAPPSTYASHARAALEQAEVEQDPEARALLLETAKKWVQLAEAENRGASRT